MQPSRRAILMATACTVAMVKWLVVSEYYGRKVEEIVVSGERAQ